ncbi:MAG: thioredoxin-disulfide reductase [Candidatus Thorarchaeota archaeon]
MTTNNNIYDIIIIGAGPSGLTASLYTSRAKFKTLTITGPMVGGQIALTYTVDNYPGFPNGITGPELSELMKKQAEKFGTEFLDTSVTSADFSSKPMKVFTDKEEFQAKSVIIATGSLNRKLGLESEERLMGRGVFVCATCDAILYQDRTVVVVGGGDSAVQEALDLSKFASKIYVVHRRDELTACRCLTSQALENDKISFIWNTEVINIIGERRVESVRLRNRKTGEEYTMKTDGVLLAIGWIPNTDIFGGQVDLDEKGYIISKNDVETSVEGVFVCGDINDTEYRQVITACGSGCKAALRAERYLQKQG